MGKQYNIASIVGPTVKIKTSRNFANEEFYDLTPPADINEDNAIDYLDIMEFVYKIMQFNR